MIASSQTSLSRLVGDSIQLSCIATGDPTPRITWFKDNSPIQYDSRHVSDGAGKLTITNARSTDSGVYSCIASNTHGRATHSIEVAVTGGNFKEYRVTSGSVVRFSCRLSFNGIPSNDVRWTHNEIPIVSGGRYAVNPSGMLTISGVTQSDRGIYRCYAESSTTGRVIGSGWDLRVTTTQTGECCVWFDVRVVW